MLDLAQDILSLTEFKTKTTEFVDQLRSSDRALLLTINGRAELAVMSAATFQRILEALDSVDAIRGIRAGLDEVREGKTQPASQYFTGFRKRRRPRGRDR
jgi:PHD/YefM family antitoxin component YafN of YafNO toxin-antitoxin module